MLVNAALLVLFLGTASPDTLNESRSARPLPSNCIEAVYSAGCNAKSGLYRISLPLDGWAHRAFYVYCLLDRNGGDPWLLVQRRQDAYINFSRNWNDYKSGFGNMDGSFFIGLEKLHALTQVQLNELQIELRDFNETVKYANYENFAVGDENEKYALNILGPYSGDAGDSLLRYHDGQKFSTYDQDNDDASRNCAELHHGGWWFRSCFTSNLNGIYYRSFNSTFDCVSWSSFHYKYSLKYAHMAIRPVDKAATRIQRC